MLFLFALEFMLMLLVLCFVLTQVVIPLWKGTALFWIFRKNSARKNLDLLSSERAIFEEWKKTRSLAKELEKDFQTEDELYERWKKSKKDDKEVKEKVDK